jgi:hypothetical protein
MRALDSGLEHQKIITPGSLYGRVWRGLTAHFVAACHQGQRRLIGFLIGMLALLLVAPLTGCSLWQAYAQREVISRARISLRAVELPSLDLKGASVRVSLNIENPTQTTLVIDRVDYMLFLNEQRALTAFTDTRLTVPAQQARPLVLNANVAFADLGTQARLFWQNRNLKNVRLEGTAYFETPLGVVEYPLRFNGNLSW